MGVDILIAGAGVFAERILCDLAATTASPITVALAGRNRERIEWLKTAAESRAAIFGRALSVEPQLVDFTDDGSLVDCLQRTRPRIIVQAASAQPSSVLGASSNAWSRLIAATSYSVTSLFQAHLSIKIARAAKQAVPGAFYINCCYPDVTNGILLALDLPVTCGLGNVSILASVMQAHRAGRGRCVQVLAHYQTLTPFRSPHDERHGPAPRVWIDGDEIPDVFAIFADVKLTRAPVIEVSGAANVPMLVAMAAGNSWTGHAPGPAGLPGGYPVRFDGTQLDLDLPAGLDRSEAIGWNAAFEMTDGFYVTPAGHMEFTGRLRNSLHDLSPNIAAGFSIADFEYALAEMHEFRERLLSMP